MTLRILGAGLCALSMTAAAALAQTWTNKTSYVLPEIRLSTFLEWEMGIKVDDHGINLGGVGSDLWHAPADGPGIYWMITDRGPNGQITVDGQVRRTFPVPEFTPFILKVKVRKRGIQILDAIPITGIGPALGGVTGMSNTSRDEVPFDCAARTQLTFNAHGLDTEGLVRMDDGTFWVAEEYSPSILRIGHDGKVLKRFLPANLTPPTTTAGYASQAGLPEILGKRKSNRGFEGLTMDRSGKLYAVVQSPILNPTTAVGNASRNVRIIAFSIGAETTVGEYVYRMQDVTEFNDTNPTEMKVSGLAMIDDRRMLVLERTDKIAKIYKVDLTSATNILGTKWDDAATNPSLEALDDAGLRSGGVTVLPKELVLTLDSAKGFPEKIEGITFLDRRRIAVANDNDFGVGNFNITAGACTLIDTGNRSQILEIRLDKPLID